MEGLCKCAVTRSGSFARHTGCLPGCGVWSARPLGACGGCRGCEGRHFLLHVGQEFLHDASELGKSGTILSPEGGEQRI